jgi:hypothetical protein
MSFLFPAFLIGAVAAAIPIVLHLLRRDVAPEVPFTAVRLLKRSPIEQSRRRRLRDLLLLAARVTALLLLACAFARPYIAGATAHDGLTIVAVDRSFSMSAPGRFERALELARTALDGAEGSRVALLTFDERADVLSQGTAGEARTALAALGPGFGATRYGAALAKAAEIAAGNPARVVVVTDMQRAGWEDEQAVVPSSMQIEWQDTGDVSANVAITGLRTTADSTSVSLRNTGSQSFDATVQITVDGRLATSAVRSVPAGGSADVDLPYRVPARGTLLVSVADPSGYSADNTRFALLDPTPRPRILVVTGGGEVAPSGFYFTRALGAAAGDDAFDVRTAPASALSTRAEGGLERQAAVVLLSTRNLDRRGRDALAPYVRNGGGLLVSAGGDVDPAALATVMGWPAFVRERAPGSNGPFVFAATDLRHPIFRPFGSLTANLGQVRFDRAWMLDAAKGWDVAARFTDGTPAMIERREGKGRVVVFASDLDRRWNDFPLHPAFVPFSVESVRYVAMVGDRRREYLVGQSPAWAKPEPGIHRSGNRAAAVNVDPRESATARLSLDEFAGMVQRVETAAPAAVSVEAQQAEARQSFWRYGLMLMLAALVAESFVGRA